HPRQLRQVRRDRTQPRIEAPEILRQTVVLHRTRTTVLRKPRPRLQRRRIQPRRRKLQVEQLEQRLQLPHRARDLDRLLRVANLHPERAQRRPRTQRLEQTAPLTLTQTRRLGHDHRSHPPRGEEQRVRNQRE